MPTRRTGTLCPSALVLSARKSGASSSPPSRRATVSRPQCGKLFTRVAPAGFVPTRANVSGWWSGSVRLGDLQAVRLPRRQLRIRRSEVERVLRAGVEAEELEPDRPPQERSQPAHAVTTPAAVTAPLKKRDRKERPVAMATMVKDGLALVVGPERCVGSGERSQVTGSIWRPMSHRSPRCGQGRSTGGAVGTGTHNRHEAW